VVGRERQVPALGVPRGAHLENAGIVEQAGDRKPEGDDLRRRAPHARKVGQVAHDRCRALAFSLDGRRISSSFLASRPTSTIVPCLASSSAVARPKPEVGPVTMYALRSLEPFIELASGIFVPV